MPEQFIKKATKTTIGGSIATGLVLVISSKTSDPEIKSLLTKASPAIGIAGDRTVHYLLANRKVIIEKILFLPKYAWSEYVRRRIKKKAEEKIETAQRFMANPYLPEKFKSQLGEDIGQAQRVVISVIDQGILNTTDKSALSKLKNDNVTPLESGRVFKEPKSNPPPKPRKPRKPRNKHS